MATIQKQYQDQIKADEIKFQNWLTNQGIDYADFLEDKRYSSLHSDARFLKSLRNIVVHNNSEKLLTINEEAISLADRFIEQVTTSIDQRMVPLRKICKANMKDKVLAKLREITNKNFTYLPIFDNYNCCVEVFSAYILQSYLCMGKSIDESTTFDDIYTALDLSDNHLYDNIEFVKEGSPYVNVICLFKPTNDFHRDVVLVTKDGDGDSPVLGMLTIWDLQ